MSNTSENSLILPATLFAEILIDKFDEEATLEDFTRYVQLNLVEIALELKGLEDCEAGLLFLDYLEKHCLYVKGSEVNWESLIRKLIESNNFKAIYNLALTYVI